MSDIERIARRLALADGWGDGDEVQVSYGMATGSANVQGEPGFPSDPNVKITKTVQVISRAPAWCRYIPQAVLVARIGQ